MCVFAHWFVLIFCDGGVMAGGFVVCMWVEEEMKGGRVDLGYKYAGSGRVRWGIFAGRVVLEVLLDLAS